MKLQPLLVGLTLVNMGLLGANLLIARPSVAASDGILRGRGLEIVDEHGRKRATLAVMPASPTDRYPDGRVGSPETVLLRLIDQHGKPNVKLGASEEGGGLGLGGGEDPAYARISPEQGRMALTLVNRAGEQRTVAAP
jgi:hypothetical protein